MASFEERQAKAPAGLLSTRGVAMLAPATPYLGHHFAALASLWCPQTRPDGIITLAVAENKLSYDLLHDRLPDLKSLSRCMAQYEDMKGTPPFRSALASFLTRHVFKASSWAVDPAHLCVSAGVGSLINHLGLALFEAGDAVLIPSPSYASFVFDLQVIAKVQCVGVPLSAPSYRLTRDALDAALAHHQGSNDSSSHSSTTAVGSRVRGLILTSPQNPLGLVYSEEELRTAIEWAREKGLHLISDEIYALSVFELPPPPPSSPPPADGEGDHASSSSSSSSSSSGGGCPGFTSVTTLLDGELGPHVHVLWGFSKDFGVSGFRCGVLFSQNEALQQALSSVSYFCAVSNPIQAALTEVLEDEAFLQTYIPEHSRRLRAACLLCCETLDALQVPYVRPSAGMFLWIDLSAYLVPPPNSSTATWDSEYALFLALKDEAGLVLTPGHSQSAPHPGCFRVCYAFASMEALAEGMQRLRGFLLKRKDENRRGS